MKNELKPNNMSALKLNSNGHASNSKWGDEGRCFYQATAGDVILGDVGDSNELPSWLLGVGCRCSASVNNHKSA